MNAENNLVVRVEFGSHLYGTNTPASDHDYKSVFIPSAEDILLQRVKGSLGHKVKRNEGEKTHPPTPTTNRTLSSVT